MTKGADMSAQISKGKGASVAPKGNVTAEQIAARVGATGKDFRRWLRGDLRARGAADAMAGKGGRYTFTASAADAIVKAYGERKARNANDAASNVYAAPRKVSAPRKARVTVSHVAPIGALEGPTVSQS